VIFDKYDALFGIRDTVRVEQVVWQHGAAQSKGLLNEYFKLKNQFLVLNKF
jgi:hypothetical protein